MKAISIKQPHVYAIQNLGKNIENRTWKLPKWIVGQPVALHASKRPDNVSVEALIWHSGKDVSVPRNIPTGAIVGLVKFSGMVTESDSIWFTGPYGWVIQEHLILPSPIPTRGSLGFWNVPKRVQREIKRLRSGS